MKLADTFPVRVSAVWLSSNGIDHKDSDGEQAVFLRGLVTNVVKTGWSFTDTTVTLVSESAPSSLSAVTVILAVPNQLSPGSSCKLLPVV